MNDKLEMGNRKVTGVATPTVSDDATNKSYVDERVKSIRTAELNVVFGAPDFDSIDRRVFTVTIGWDVNTYRTVADWQTSNLSSGTSNIASFSRKNSTQINIVLWGRANFSQLGRFHVIGHKP